MLFGVLRLGLFGGEEVVEGGKRGRGGHQAQHKRVQMGIFGSVR